MNCLSINIRGAGNSKKAEWIRGIKTQYQINFLSCQETQFRDGSLLKLNLFWDDSPFDSVVADANGRSGGMFCMWNPNIFKVEEIIQDNHFILVAGKWGTENFKVSFINIYAPVDSGERRTLWFNLLNIRRCRSSGAWLLMGDFNEVTCSSDRFSEQACISSMNDFINFIRDFKLTEFNLGGRRFTWMSSDGKKLSKIDRFLACNIFLNKWFNSSVTALPRRYSDHFPLILTAEMVDYGPCPFIFFNSWLLIQGIRDIVIKEWAISIGSVDADIALLKKLQKLKAALREWRNDLRKKENGEYDYLLKNIDDIETIAESRNLTDQERENRRQWQAKIDEIDLVKNMDLKQKARLKWDVDGDENSKFFHSWVNHKRKKKQN